VLYLQQLWRDLTLPISRHKGLSLSGKFQRFDWTAGLISKLMTIMGYQIEQFLGEALNETRTALVKKYPLTGIIIAVFIVQSGIYPLHALDVEVKAEENPFAFFKNGVLAYKNGKKDEALQALRYAADMGHIGAKWKLARMYAEGDGVVDDDYAAYQLFLSIVNDNTDTGIRNESYISDALLALGFYSRYGIANTEIEPRPARARSFYLQAASNYGNATAQYELGRMLLHGEGGAPDKIQAARWFQLAARKGHAAAQAMLGDMLFQAGKTVRGLAMMTAAFEHSKAEDRPWIAEMQARAFAVASENDRRTAITMASNFLADNAR